MKMVLFTGLVYNWYLLYLKFAGTQGKTMEFLNPHTTGRIIVACSCLKDDSKGVESVVGRTGVRCVSDFKENMWFSIDFQHKFIRPTSYTLRHYISWGNLFLISFFECRHRSSS